MAGAAAAHVLLPARRRHVQPAVPPAHCLLSALLHHLTVTLRRRRQSEPYDLALMWRLLQHNPRAAEQGALHRAAYLNTPIRHAALLLLLERGHPPLHPPLPSLPLPMSHAAWCLPACLPACRPACLPIHDRVARTSQGTASSAPAAAPPAAAAAPACCSEYEEEEGLLDWLRGASYQQLWDRLIEEKERLWRARLVPPPCRGWLVIAWRLLGCLACSRCVAAHPRRNP